MITGRYLTFHIEQFLRAYSELGVTLPSTAHQLYSGRTDLVCHDIYSYLLGSLTLGAIYIPTRFFWSVSTFGWTRISRRNAVRRPSRTVRHGEADPLISDPAAQRNSVIATWWLAHGRRISSQVRIFFISKYDASNAA